MDGCTFATDMHKKGMTNNKEEEESKMWNKYERKY